VVIAGLSALLLIAGPAGAHSSLGEASPGPGDIVGGTVDSLELVFLQGVSDASISLRTPDGVLTETTVSQPSELEVRAEFDALEEPGQYIVDWGLTSADGDSTAASYAFSYDPDAPPREELSPSTSNPAIPIALAVMLALLVVGFVFMRRDRPEVADSDA
jgi:methionine-rich copper-binding protein CopC